MPSDYEKDAYPKPPLQTPVVEKKTSLPNPADILSKLFYYSVDLPVTTFRGAIDSLQSKKKLVYYHQKFRRVPYLTECVEGDYVCYYEAEMQWRRDHLVNQEILKIVQERLQACHYREGESYEQNCAKELKLFEEVAKNFNTCYGDLGAQATARKCLMKQKQRMMEAQSQSA
ncbi:NADH dehydrogenase [ubiquinone] 1 beta subcomplex subunit 10 [Synchiropus splendidus]|uniref:NADH dehydrogenase [ubiquinone] 1 beta subcomplex subunit 10 n=1 Tax=Synchiropus splendidus TaxID=270530 RepID=UPI00237EE831|nr:NADH dehydrogenase [ubiquinone] 1 beta subcomplex subunit 10 [Synchiropus splendidus]